ncbi:MAG: hypothetical protein IPK20_02030 [Betaproteobacteria bacterium]|nr:hypothetical protein [Betaproteobacteria bacterium]
MTAPRVWLGTDGIVHVDYSAVGVLTLGAVKAEFEFRRTLVPGRQLVMARLPGIWRVDVEAATFLASPEVSRHTLAEAGVVQSSLGIAALRVFELYHPPPFPFRIFGSEEDAQEWLLGLDIGSGGAGEEHPTLRTYW